ncbi:MAG TPA: sigma 54-interacting transcriptional regulator [Terriglobales bacterium]|nr:sigma 54-interacting transcriptional regulator [Terriglobales bacterium]
MSETFASSDNHPFEINVAHTNSGVTGPDAIFLRYQALLNIGDSFAHQQSLVELFADLAAKLKDVAGFDLLIFALHDASSQLMRLTVVDRQSKMSQLSLGVNSSGSGQAWQNQQGLIIADVSEEQKYAETAKYLGTTGMRSACLLPLSVPARRLGALGFARSLPHCYSVSDLDFLQRVASFVALAVDNLLSRQNLQEDKQRLQMLLEVSQTLSSSLDFERLFPVISDSLRRILPVDHASISVPDRHRDGVNLYLIHPPIANFGPGEFVPSADSITTPAMQDRKPVLYSRSDLENTRSSVAKRLVQEGMEFACCLPLVTSHGAIGTLTLASAKEPVAVNGQADLLAHVANNVAIALENARAYQEIAALKNKLAEEKLYLEDEIRTELNFEEIIGDSPQLKRALADARTVAPSAATVLILGETGTGKELIARAIHKMSARKDNSFIKLNCAAIPTGLLESELFGHEKGAFTGAISQKIGRMELAHGGTLFLDEVGDIPLELQPKLLRVLQDQEFERLGSTRTLKVNVRLIAATNRDLATLVAAREFRSDLYYRLRVFPIQLPPLRERRQDIRLLVRYFVQRLSRRMNKVIDSIPAATMEVLNSWDWPGNIRELENFLERSVILSKGPTLTIPAAELRPLNESSSRRDTSLETAEREHILRILRETGGVISGARGAAARLGLKRTTLQSKMQKLGISRLDYQA